MHLHILVAVGLHVQLSDYCSVVIGIYSLLGCRAGIEGQCIVLFVGYLSPYCSSSVLLSLIFTCQDFSTGL
ncbi:MAG: hypothetical protein MJZ15_02510 [Bacteroidales bacterium]|nr:hypothetical protein [Bacteroidales bacterium]